MKIDSSSVALASSHISTERHTVREQLRFWTGPRPDFAGPDFAGTAQARAGSSSIVSLTEQAKAVQPKAVQPKDETQKIQDANDAVNNDPKMMLIRLMLEALTGNKIKLVSSSDLQPADVQDPQGGAPLPAGQASSSSSAQPAPPQPGFGLEYERSVTHDETEQSNFFAQGVVKTADGQEIRFDLRLSMQRAFHSEDNTSLRIGNAVRKDPLVINFSGTAAQLTDSKFMFDIDADGKRDSISFVGTGSGFLALDINGNGKIDNGSELFGTRSGNGFADLAKFDSNGNHWIDQNDAVYNKLRVWAKDASGKDSLSSLAEHGVGALYLGNVATPFSINNNSNTPQGQIRASSLYLNENGSTGTLQQVDLAV